MSETTITNVLWADDDADTNLQPIARMLKRRGAILTIVEDYHAASTALSQASPPGQEFTAFLVDTILPSGIMNATLGNNLGVDLAGRAAALGIRFVVFLSVVPYEEIDDRFDSLKKAYPLTHFKYFHKLDLLEDGHFDMLVTALRTKAL